VKHVFVNGVQVLKDGEHTGAKPGRALWGPGKKIAQANALSLQRERKAAKFWRRTDLANGPDQKH
jgi:hypothetical protein